MCNFVRLKINMLRGFIILLVPLLRTEEKVKGGSVRTSYFVKHFT